MKKIFTYLAVAALMAVACEGMYGPVEAPTAPDQAGSVEIQIDTLGDETFTFTVAPVGEVSYYSYFVATGAADAVDSLKVYQCKYDGLAKGTCKAADQPEVTVTVDGVLPNLTYTIYAVAGSPQGIPSSVVVKEVHTTDQVAVAITNFSAPNDSTVVLSFTEKVLLGDGKITATYYTSVPSVAAAGTLEPESVVVDGSGATVTFAGLPAGAYYAVSYTEGTFTDDANNKIKALTSGYNAEAKKFAGVYSRKETANFDLAEAFPAEYAMFSDWQTAVFSVALPGDEILAATGEGAAKAIYSTPGKTVTIDMVLNQHYVFGQNGIMMVCPEQPAFGTQIAFSFAEDAFQDIWGNSSNAAEYQTLCAYDYTIADVLGTYAFEAYDNVSKDYMQSTFKVEASDDSEQGNVMITSFAGIPCQTPIYATFTPASGSLEIYGFQPFYGYVAEDGTQVDYVFYTYNYDYLHLTMTESGVLTSPDDYFGAVVAYDGELAAWGYLFLDFYAEKTQAAPAVAAQSAKIVKFENTLPLNVR